MFFGWHREAEQPDARRTCEVDGDKAFFHTWTLAGYAIVEYIDGHVEMVHPDRVRFTDR